MPKGRDRLHDRPHGLGLVTCRHADRNGGGAFAFAEMRQVELAGLEAPGPVEGDKIDGIDGREGVIGHGRSTFGIGSTDADSETFVSIPPWRPLPVGDI